ncbi:TPA: hypothetical protein ACS3VG_002695 [Klebsiella aerogenes]|uniref:hypothetical protein n=1 Tax=Klebsiella aerogenes TaxID=548 RepID=UPI000449B20F|nr:hypothetical protein [Klebsiella aerogenes]DAM02145.1 MAG TPA: protein of unknown function (DUF5490) [Caudoviricetes sp.]EUL55785.1 hypothetical protein P848_02446 [Klebsiella aerogenes UCI 45]EUL75615.1 hypothetical protein P831_04191 [Klebsiella aerogenes UCI 28]EUL83151.1 hypothetical protein P830_02166 [Klebsiella aerogenes UCI 27]MCP1406044.1 hypothetical protein [Klebsiella aerogenes]
MNNEIEQIAQQNDMSIEFVRWFFNEKKADCGEQWFLALGAMWEGWKAREGEVTALALTLEKSREASGCPADVDLQDWVKQLAAENVGLKNVFIQKEIPSEAVDAFMETAVMDHDWNETSEWSWVENETEVIHAVLDALKPDTPATDRIVAGIKADAANQMCVSFVKHKELAGLSDDDEVTVREATDVVLHCAEVISEGADK